MQTAKWFIALRRQLKAYITCMSRFKYIRTLKQRIILVFMTYVEAWIILYSRMLYK